MTRNHFFQPLTSSKLGFSTTTHRGRKYFPNHTRKWSDRHRGQDWGSKMRTLIQRRNRGHRHRTRKMYQWCNNKCWRGECSSRQCIHCQWEQMRYAIHAFAPFSLIQKTLGKLEKDQAYCATLAHSRVVSTDAKTVDMNINPFASGKEWTTQTKLILYTDSFNF